MVYVLKREEDENIMILPFLPISTGDEEEEGEKLLYKFSWDYNETLPCIRWFTLDYAVEKSSVYIPAVLDYLGTIKSLPAPPQEELKRIYGVKKKIQEFSDTINVLSDLSLIPRPENDTLLSPDLVYDIDFASQIYRVYPQSVCDLAFLWLGLDTDIKEAIKELHKTKNLKKQNEIISKLNIPLEFLPIGLKINLGEGGREKGPEYKRHDLIAEVKEESEKEAAIRKFREGAKIGDIVSSKDLDTIGLNIPDITPYFELSRDWRNKTYTITKIL